MCNLPGIPYRGTGPAMNDLVGGQIDFMCDQTTNTTNQIKDGTIKAYAVTTTRERIATCPTSRRSSGACKGFEISAWHAIWAPKGTAKEVPRSSPERCRRRSRTRR